MRLITIILILFLLTGCNIFDNRSKSILITDKDYYEIKRQYSPDKTKLLLTYGLNQGATGQGEVGTAILHLSDTSKDIKPFTIAWHEYQECKWLSNDTAIVYLDYLKRMRLGTATRMYYDTSSINGVQIKYDLKDIIDSSYSVDTLFNQVSPNNEYRAVAYRYINSVTKENFLNISVIGPTGVLPKYGNYFISDIKNDYVYNGEWTKSNELILYVTSTTENIITSYLVQNRWDIQLKIIADDNKFGTALRWTKKNGY
jgi:hypothetical protein